MSVSLSEIIGTIRNNQDKLNRLFIKCHKIYKQISPSKNENKFPFGILIQMAIIDFLNDIFHKCLDLDECHKYGSEYKNDCCLYVDDNRKIDLSIKAKSNDKNDTIIINNYGNDIDRDLSNLVSIILVINTNKMYIIEHNIIDEKFIIRKSANITYRSSLLTFINKNKRDLCIELEKNEEFERFMRYEYEKLVAMNVYKKLYHGLSL